MICVFASEILIKSVNLRCCIPDKKWVLRSGRVNEAIRYIYLMNSKLSGKKKTNQNGF